jgi:hypothetical protein
MQGFVPALQKEGNFVVSLDQWNSECMHSQTNSGHDTRRASNSPRHKERRSELL